MSIADAATTGYINETVYLYDSTSTSGQPYKALTETPGFENLVTVYDGFGIRLEENATLGDKLRIPLVK